MLLDGLSTYPMYSTKREINHSFRFIPIYVELLFVFLAAYAIDSNIPLSLFSILNCLNLGVFSTSVLVSVIDSMIWHSQNENAIDISMKLMLSKSYAELITIVINMCYYYFTISKISCVVEY